MRPFNILRACFYLLAFMMLLEILASIAGGTLCWYLTYLGRQEPGGCTNFIEMIRELWSELITAVLALLLAATSKPPDQE